MSGDDDKGSKWTKKHGDEPSNRRDSIKTTYTNITIAERLKGTSYKLGELLKQKSPLAKLRHTPSFTTYDPEDRSFKQTIKFPPSLIESIQSKIIKKLGLDIAFISFRVNQIGTKATRRDSFVLQKGDTKIDVSAGKPVTSKQKTQPEGYLGAGQLVAHHKFLTNERGLISTDNNELGHFPITAVKASDSYFTSLRNDENGDIIDVRTVMNGLLVCYAKKVTQYDYDGKPINDVVTDIHLIKRKHYIQSADSLKTIFTNIALGNYILLPQSNSKQLIVRDRLGNVAMLDLNKMINADGEHFIIFPDMIDKFIKNIATVKDVNSKEYKRVKRAAKKFINEFLIRDGEDTELSNVHVPIFKQGDRKPNIWVPFMVSCEGFAITGDADAEHISIPNHLPAVVHKTFNSFKPNSKEEFTIGLKILVARLEARNCAEFIHACAKHGIDQIVLRKYLCNIELDHPDCFVVYNEALLLKATKKILAKVTDDPGLLARVGVMNIFTVVLKFTLKNRFFLHGSEELHPFPIPEKFAGILSFIRSRSNTEDVREHAKSETMSNLHRMQANTKKQSDQAYDLSQTDDEDTYIQFIFANPRILINNSINVHPYWLRQREGEEQELSDAWLKVLEVQALVQLRRGFKDVKLGKISADKFAVFYNDYKTRLKDNMLQGRKGDVDKKAWQLIENMFSDIDNNFINKDSSRAVDKHILNIFNQISKMEYKSNEMVEEALPKRTISSNSSCSSKSNSSNCSKIKKGKGNRIS